VKTLDRHILKELIGPFLFGVAAFTSIMFAGKELFSITELVAEYHASLLTAGKLVMLFLPSLVVMTLPMAMLLAALLGFGRLSGDSEVVALFASGISLYRIVIPVILMAIAVTGMSFVLNEIIAPKAISQHDRIVREMKHVVMNSSKPVLDQDVVNGITQSFYYVAGGFDATKGVARRVTVIQVKAGKPVLLVYGKEAFWEGDEHPNIWNFKDGYYTTLDPKGSLTVAFPENSVVINRRPEQFELFEEKASQMSFGQLARFIDILRNEGRNTRELRVLLYQKISLPLATLVFALIGAPLGLRPQRSSSAMGLGLSIVIIFAYWVFTHYMSILGDNGTISAAAASFLPTLAGIGAGIALIVRAVK